VPRRFCPKCGKENVELIEGLCSECYFSNHSFLKLPKEINIAQCKKCNTLHLSGKWIDFNLIDLKKYISKQIKTELEEPEYAMNILDRSISGSVSGKKGRAPVVQEFELPFKIKLSICDKCMKTSTTYWEIKIQLRKNKSCDLKKYIKIEKELIKRNDFQKQTKQGDDFFFISMQDGKQFIKHLSNRYRTKPLISKRFSGFRKSGGKKIKYTYCFRV